MKAEILLLAMVTMVCGGNAEVPSSARSREAVARVEPKLQEELAKKGLVLGAPVFIRIFKEPAVLEVWMKKEKTYERFRSYQICKFSGALGPKLKEGDKQAPEGFYTVGPDQLNPGSRFHLSFNLGYPNAYDAHHKRTGSALMVHGACVSVGCYAMGDAAIEEIWTLCSRALEKGQKKFPAHIFPFPLTEAKLKRREQSPWIDFWKRELQPGFEAFEKSQVPPEIKIKEGRYVVVAPKEP